MSNIRSSGSGAIRLAAAACCLCAVTAPGRTADFQARWNELASLVAGREVTISLPEGPTVTGEVMTVNAQGLTMDVHKASGAGARKGMMTIQRASVTRVRASKMESAWGRRLGVALGQASGIVGGAEFGAHVGRSEAGAVSSFFAIYVGATVGGYYLGKARDRHTVEIEILPASSTEVPGGERQAPPSARPSLVVRGGGK